MDELIAELTRYGLIIDGTPDLSGKLHRCKTTDSKSNKPGWYIGWLRLFNGKDYITCIYGDWSKSDETHTFKSWQDDRKLSPAELEQIKQTQQEAQKKIEQSKRRQHQQTAQTAQLKWQALSETGSSQYLSNKGVKGFGIRYGTGKIVVPLRDESGALTSLQTIYDNGDKRFLSGGRIKGCCHVIGKISPLMPLCFAEGYATAASIHY